MNFPEAGLPQLQNFGNNFCRSATFLSSPRERHNAERAEFIAAFDDGNESHVRRMPLDWGNIPDFSLGALAEIYNGGFPSPYALDHRGNSVRCTGSRHHIDDRR